MNHVLWRMRNDQINAADELGFFAHTFNFIVRNTPHAVLRTRYRDGRMQPGFSWRACRRQAIDRSYKAAEVSSAGVLA
jgi:hypothetical protein